MCVERTNLRVCREVLGGVNIGDTSVRVDKFPVLETNGLRETQYETT